LTFEEFVNKKIESERVIFEKLSGLTNENILKSNLSEFTKNFLLTECKGDFEKENLPGLIEKSNKLYFNYTLRPKWTLLAYLFNNFESRPPDDILLKLEYFPFYRFYADSIRNFIEQNAQIFITKNETKAVIDETNKLILEKLTADISGDKIKNFFRQIFIMKYGDDKTLNLESSVPYQFIKIFLADKSFDSLLKKYTSATGISEEGEVSLKDLIKILTDKFTKAESEAIVTEKKPEPLRPVIAKEEEKPMQEKIVVKSKDEDKKNKSIYSDELIEAESKTPSKIIPDAGKNEVIGSRLKKLIGDKLNDKITEVIYNSDLISKSKSFSKLNNYKTWFEASSHLKEIFKNNKVNIYDKDVIRFINILEEFYQKQE